MAWDALSTPWGSSTRTPGPCGGLNHCKLFISPSEATGLMDRDKKQHKHWPNKPPLYHNHRTSHEPRSVFPTLSLKFDLFHIYRTAESMLLTTIAIIHSLKCLFRSTPPSSDSTPWYTPIYSYGFIIKCSRSAKRHISTSVGRTGLFAPLSLDFLWFLPPCTTSPVPAMCVSLDFSLVSINLSFSNDGTGWENWRENRWIPSRRTVLRDIESTIRAHAFLFHFKFFCMPQ